MNRISSILATIAVTAATVIGVPHASATATVGQPAPAFSAVDTQGKTRTLAEFKGKRVVLEWHNQKCPYVVKHYSGGNMQRLQKELRETFLAFQLPQSLEIGVFGTVWAACLSYLV